MADLNSAFPRSPFKCYLNCTLHNRCLRFSERPLSAPTPSADLKQTTFATRPESSDDRRRLDEKLRWTKRKRQYYRVSNEVEDGQTSRVERTRVGDIIAGSETSPSKCRHRGEWKTNGFVTRVVRVSTRRRYADDRSQPSASSPRRCGISRTGPAVG